MIGLIIAFAVGTICIVDAIITAWKRKSYVFFVLSAAIALFAFMLGAQIAYKMGVKDSLGTTIYVSQNLLELRPGIYVKESAKIDRSPCWLMQLKRHGDKTKWYEISKDARIPEGKSFEIIESSDGKGNKVNAAWPFPM